mmetsp:Transcript_17469/g.30112  ORF Transcript_17469/g.30112 Transcript_17469/m.30112 type:complete len:470 (-) Transcript_17469:767-2176(-)
MADEGAGIAPKGAAFTGFNALSAAKEAPLISLSDGPAAAPAVVRDLPPILNTTINWDKFKTATLISNREYEIIKQYDKQSTSRQQELLDKDGEVYMEAFLNMLKLSAEDAVQYILALIDEALTERPDRVQIFYKLSARNIKIYAPFTRLLSKNTSDVFSIQKASKILALLLSKKQAPDEELAMFVNWQISQLKSSSTSEGVLLAVTGALMVQLRNEQSRMMFFRSNGLPLLVALLKSQSLQLLYQTIFCIWLLSYYQEAIPAFADAGVVPGLIQLLKTVTKEKVVRISVATLINVLGKGRYSNDMVQYGLVRVLQTLSYHKWSDDDLIDDMKLLIDSLAESIKELSSFDVYRMEVLSGKLDWTPVHKQESFWKENSTKFEGNDAQVLKVLVDLLKTSKDPKALAIACHDLGEFIRFHPRGKNMISSLGAKVELLKLMEHSDVDVRKYALLAVQKLLVSHWADLTPVSNK